MEVLPVNLVALVAVVMGCLAFLIPIAGVTARFALKPMAEAIARMRESGATRETIQLLERRMALLEHEQQSVSDIRKDMERLVQALDFQTQLAKPDAPVRGVTGGAEDH